MRRVIRQIWYLLFTLAQVANVKVSEGCGATFAYLLEAVQALLVGNVFTGVIRLENMYTAQKNIIFTCYVENTYRSHMSICYQTCLEANRSKRTNSFVITKMFMIQ